MQRLSRSRFMRIVMRMTKLISKVEKEMCAWLTSGVGGYLLLKIVLPLY